MAKFQHVVRKVLEGGGEASVGGANVSHYNSIIIRFSIYIYAKCLCCLVAFTVLESSLSLCKSDYLRLVLFWFVFVIQKIRESIKNVELYETEYSFLKINLAEHALRAHAEQIT